MNKKPLFILFLFLLPLCVYSNAGRRIYYRVNGITSEPELILKHKKFVKSIPVVVEKEDLFIDARELVNKNKVLIKATYYLKSLKNIRNLRLIFYSSSKFKNTDFKVTFDNGNLKWKTVYGRLPLKWYPMNYFTKLREKRRADIRTDIKHAQFQLHLIKKGRHVLRVSYSAPANEDVTRLKIKKGWEIIYILEPAKHFAGFKKLNVKVLIPENWNFKSNVDFKRKKNSLLVNFNELIKPSITVTLWTNKGVVFYQILYYSSAVLVFLIIAVLFLRIIKSRNKVILFSFISGFFASVLYLILYVNEISFLKTFLGNQININYARGRVYYVFIFPLILIISFLIMVSFNFIVYEFVLNKYKEKK